MSRCTSAASRSCSTASGVTGDDGASHNGMWDMSVLQVVPACGWRRRATSTRMRELLDEAVEVADAPTVVRFPKGPPPDGHRGDRPGRRRRRARARRHSATCSSSPSVRWRASASTSAERLTAQGIGVTVVDPRWVKPVDPALVELARRPPAGRHHRGQRRHRRRRRRAAADALGRRRRHAGAAARHPPGVPRPREAGRHPRAHRPVGPDDRPRHRARDDRRRGPSTPRLPRRTTGRSSMPTGTAEPSAPAAGCAVAGCVPATAAAATACLPPAARQRRGDDDSPVAPHDPEAATSPTAIQRTLRQRARALVDRGPGRRSSRTSRSATAGFLAEQDLYFDNLGQLPLDTAALRPRGQDAREATATPTGRRSRSASSCGATTSRPSSPATAGGSRRPATSVAT